MLNFAKSGYTYLHNYHITKTKLHLQWPAVVGNIQILFPYTSCLLHLPYKFQSFFIQYLAGCHNALGLPSIPAKIDGRYWGSPYMRGIFNSNTNIRVLKSRWQSGLSLSKQKQTNFQFHIANSRKCRQARSSSRPHLENYWGVVWSTFYIFLVCTSFL